MLIDSSYLGLRPHLHMMRMGACLKFRLPFSIRFFMVAIIFLVFDVELILIYPAVPAYLWACKTHHVTSILNFWFNFAVFVQTAVPSLSSPTPELLENAKEAASGYLSLLTEYLASLGLAQLSLKLADQGLELLENAAVRVLPESKGRTFIRYSVRKVQVTYTSLSLASLLWFTKK